jgi:serine/threonine protein kinase
MHRRCRWKRCGSISRSTKSWNAWGGVAWALSTKPVRRRWDRLVAIKVLAGERQEDVTFAKRFEREAKILAQMSHPNIVTVHDFGESDGLYYLVMEYVDGVNLRDLLADGKIDPKQALAIVPPICEALEYAHDKGVVHRDIKPENLLLDREGRVKIADFGIASLVGASGEKSGTPPYMAPEQEKGVVDRRADIYALGAVLYEMLTGERPDKDLVAPSKRIQIDVRLDEIVLRALEKEPERRYQTAAEFRTMVQTIATVSPDGRQYPEAKNHKTIKTQSRKSDSPQDRPSHNGRMKFAILLVISITAGILGERLMSDYLVRKAGAPINAQMAREAITPHLEHEGYRWEEMIFEPNTVSPSDVIVRFRGLEIQAAPGTIGEWIPIDGNLNLRTLDGTTWRATGLKDLSLRFDFTLGPVISTTDSPRGWVKFRYKLVQSAEQAREIPVSWGDWNAGWSLRLRADRSVAPANELPEFAVDLRKRENAEPDALRRTLHGWLMEVDGHRYRLSIRSTAWETKVVFQPGTTELAFLRFQFHRDETGPHVRLLNQDGVWVNSYAAEQEDHNRERAELDWKPGKHVVRLMFPLSSTSADHLVTSNPVKIDIIPATTASGISVSENESKANERSMWPYLATMLIVFIAAGLGIRYRSRCQQDNQAHVDQGRTKGQALPSPRFSRMAIVGACWAIFAFLAAFLMFWQTGPKHTLPAAPGIWKRLLGMAFLASGVAAPFGTTLLGWIAVTRIRRSVGKLYGLGLAVFDGVLFPLLAVDGLIAWLGYRIVVLVWQEFRGQRELDSSGITVWLILVMTLCMVADYLIIRWTWRMAGRQNKPECDVSSIDPADTHRYAKEITIVGCGTIFFICYLFFALEFPKFKTSALVAGLVGLLICILSWAGIWPFPSPVFPEPNFSSRNLRRRNGGSSGEAR